MKNVLLPTDLTVQSLTPIHRLVSDANNEKIAISLVHLLSLPTSITDLLFLEEKKPYHAVSENFIEAYQLLQYKYKSVIEKIEFSFVYCNTTGYLNNYIKGHQIDEVYLLCNYTYGQPLQQSQKVETLVKKCAVPLLRIPVNAAGYSEYQTLSTLLAGNKTEKITSDQGAKSSLSYS